MSIFVVTGAAGFIGSHLSHHLLTQGHTVVGLDNMTSGKTENLGLLTPFPTFRWVEGDIRSIDTCHTICQGADYVLHHAALGSVPESLEKPALYNAVNIEGTLNMLQAAKQANVKRFVLATSASIYGNNPILPKVESLFPEPQSPYAITKLVGEYYCQLFNNTYGLPTVCLRYFNVFGPRQNPNSQYAAVIPKFIEALSSQRAPIIFGDGEQTRDFVFIEDVIHANLKSCEAPLSACGKVYNIGTGTQTSLNTLLSTLISLTNSPLSAQFEPVRAGDVKYSVSDISLAQSLLNFQPAISLRDGLQKILAYTHAPTQ